MILQQKARDIAARKAEAAAASKQWAINNQAVDPISGVDYSLPIPGTGWTATPPKPNYSFGTSYGSTLNPLPMISTIGNELAANTPIAGPYLKRTGEEVDAAFANWWNGTFNSSDVGSGENGSVTVADIAGRNADMSRQNPTAATVGKVGGAVLPYVLAAEVPLLNQALGMVGTMGQRAAMTIAAQGAINTGDNLANGQQPIQAVGNAVMPTLLAVPGALLGPAGVKMRPELADAVDMLKREGIPLTGGQATGSKKMMRAESEFGGHAAKDFQEEQLRAFTKAQLKFAGVAGDLADSDTLKAALDDTASKFSSLASTTSPIISGSTYQDMLRIADDYVLAKGPNAAPVLENIIQRAGAAAAENGGVLASDQYAMLTADIGKFASRATDTELKTALGELREILDDAVEQSMDGKALEEWRRLRAQYQNLVTIKDAVSRGGRLAPQGLVDPVSLNNAINDSAGWRSYDKDYTDLAELSRAGRLAMPPLPDSGPATRAATQILAGLGSPAAISSYFASGGDPLAALGTAAGTLAAAGLPYATGKVLLSEPGRKFIARDGSTIPSTVSPGLLPLLLGQ